MIAFLRNGVCVVGTTLLVAACSTSSPSVDKVPMDYTQRAVDFSELPGWNSDKVERALPALYRSCDVFSKKAPETLIGKGAFTRTAGDWQYACSGLMDAAHSLHRASLGESDDDDFQTNFDSGIRAQKPDLSTISGQDVRKWLRSAFTPYHVTDAGGNPTGTFTGYYEAEINGSIFYAQGYPYPVYGKPVDLVTRTQNDKRVTGRLNGTKVVPYPTRKDIDLGAIEKVAPILMWTDDLVDLHIAHIQGSARVSLPDGRKFRIGYAGNNGHKFKGLGRILLDANLIEASESSMPRIRDWLHAFPKQAERLMWENPRYIFFRAIEGDGPIGAFGVPLTPRRSLAVDRRVVPLGAPVWLNSKDPDGQPLRRLMVAQDIGSAIKGMVRGDFYWGTGKAAFDKAGRMKSRGEYFVLIPTVKTMPELLPEPISSQKMAPKNTHQDASESTLQSQNVDDSKVQTKTIDKSIIPLE